MPLRIATIVLAMMLVLGQFILPAIAGEYEHDPDHDGHDCAICAFVQADDDDLDGLLPDSVPNDLPVRFAAHPRQHSAVDEAVTTSPYQSRGPPWSVPQ
ncbi:MAG: hypothetical protein AAFY34_02520 [Pseudomonadota bacterium]